MAFKRLLDLSIIISNIRLDMVEKALVITAPIRSHLVPAMYVAEILRERYEFHFAVDGDVLKQIAERNGHKTRTMSSFRILVGMEPLFILQQKRSRPTKWRILKSVYKNEILSFRQRELAKCITEINPSVIFVDIFASTDFIVLFTKFSSAKVIFINPMLSTYRVNGYLSIDQSEWIAGTPAPRSEDNEFSFRDLVENPLQVLLNVVRNRQFQLLTARGGFSQKHPVAKNTVFVRLFKNIPELILAPLELEVSPLVRRENQFYLGLSIIANRQETEVDPLFVESFEKILRRKRQRESVLIYCAFGTYYTGSDRHLLDFVTRLVSATSSIDNAEVILSVNKLVADTLRAQNSLPKNISLFKGVPQLNVLKHADIFVTHGGLGSVKESIAHAVPLLVYPLDAEYDQPSNAFKVEFHRIGLRGVFRYERAVDMQRKIEQILNDSSFRDRIVNLKLDLERRYEKEKLLRIIETLI